MQSEQPPGLIDMVLERLVENFVKPLNQLSKEKNYFTYVVSLAEIVDWSREFFKVYSGMLNDWNTFKSSSENIFKADNINDFVMAFGHLKFKVFCMENGNDPDYFLEKYSTIEF